MVTARALPPTPTNEPVQGYAPGSPERETLQQRLEELSKETIEVPCVIGGQEVTTGDTFENRAPHDHDLLLANVHAAGRGEVERAIDSALAAKEEWAAAPWEERAAVFLRAAELLAGRWRNTLNGATMLGQSKTVHQAEIDSACELIDFLRFNVHYYAQILGEQPPLNSPGVWNRVDHRPLEGFVLALTPFNFTSIAGNLPTAPALCGNTVVWKPSEKQAYAAHFFMQLLQEAGLPDGVINLLHGDGALVSDVAIDHHDFAGLHFTGSVVVMRELWKKIGDRVAEHRTFPRIVGETGGKDFVVAHASADVDSLATALVRGAFEYQGQKCSAASRAYVPRELWPELREQLVDRTESLRMGDITDFTNFLGAVIDETAFRRHEQWLGRARDEDGLTVVTGGDVDGSEGWFVEPTIIEVDDPRHEIMETELFGPILSVYVTDEPWHEVLELVDTTSPFGLTGAVFATDRGAVEVAAEALRHAAGNFYVNDKPTGAVVGQQPFGGARASGTNDKAGSKLNLLRWISPRAIKENLDPPMDHRYPFLGDG
ncbi:MAG: L-glutamate gamma-semialdehyde dehydrogenase [Nitriliruptorales bacterium]|nr:L-glutamate gamma-semialdehyde dehydrogenase [Nitriliruptorales bacterium]